MGAWFIGSIKINSSSEVTGQQTTLLQIQCRMRILCCQNIWYDIKVDSEDIWKHFDPRTLTRVRLHRKLWYVEINVKIEIRRYWWIEEKSSSVSTKSRLDRPRPDKKSPVFKLGWASFYLHGLGIFSFASHLWSFNAFSFWKLNRRK